MSALSQIIRVQPCSHLDPTHTKYHHIISSKTLRFNSLATNQRPHQFIPKCTGTTADKGDTDNRPPDIRKQFEKVVMNKSIDGDTDNRPPDIRKIFEKVVVNKNIEGNTDNRPPNISKLLEEVVMKKNIEGDTDNNPPDIRKLFEKVVLNKNIKGDTDNRPPDIRKLFENVVMNKNIDELSELIDSSMSLYKVLTIVSVFHTKKQLFQLLFSLLALMANHVEFVIKPSAYDGTNLGIKWNFEWKGRQIPLGKSCSLNIGHAYKGTLSLRKVNALIHPFLHLVSKLKRIAPHSALEGRRRDVLYGLTSILLMTISFILLHKAIV